MPALVPSAASGSPTSAKLPKLHAALVSAVAANDAHAVDAVLRQQPELHFLVASLVVDKAPPTHVSRFFERCCATVPTRATGWKPVGLRVSVAVLTSQVNSVQVLLSQGANVNAKMVAPGQPLDGMTPLHLAARAGLLEVARVLLVHRRIDVKVVDARGLTAVETAISRSTGFAIFKLLHALGCVADFMDKSSKSLLMLAVQSGEITVVKYVLENGGGVLVDATTGPNCATPLMVAAADGRGDLFELLTAFRQNNRISATTTVVDRVE